MKHRNLSCVVAGTFLLGLTASACFVLFFAFERVLRIDLHSGFVTDRILEMISG